MIYRYYMPTRVISGGDCVVNSGSIFKTLGKKALIVTGANSAKRNGAEKDVKAALGSVGIPYEVFDKVMSNPTISCVYEGAACARENAADFIIAIGGGSPMDAGKAIALLAAQDIEEEKLFSGSYAGSVLPMAFVPTTAGTGSEVTPYSILTNDKAQTKTSMASDSLFPDVAFLDPKYMEHLPVDATVNTAVDALSHAVEGMLSVRASIISDALASESMRRIAECVPHLLKALKSASGSAIGPETRELLLQASFMAGIVIAQTGTTAVHAMGYSLTYFKDIDHGRANGLLLGEYLELAEKAEPELAGRICRAMGLSGANQFKALLKKLLGKKEEISPEEISPEEISPEEISPEEISRYSRIAMETKNIANSVVKPTEKEIIEMYRASFA